MSAMNSTSATMPIAMMALSRRPRLTAAETRDPPRAEAVDSANPVNLRHKIDGRHYRAWYHGLGCLNREPHDDPSAQSPDYSGLRACGLQRGGVRRARQSRTAAHHRCRAGRAAHDDHRG